MIKFQLFLKQIIVNCYNYLINIDITINISLICVVYTFTDKRADYLNFPEKVRKQFAVHGILGTGSYGEVRLAFEKVNYKQIQFFYLHIDLVK